MGLGFVHLHSLWGDMEGKVLTVFEVEVKD